MIKQSYFGLFFIFQFIAGLSLKENDHLKFSPESEIALPKWPQKYFITAYLYLPYAELNEHVAAYFNGKTKQSRIDYYGGLSKTIQRGDQGEYGRHYMTAYMSNEKVRNELNCFQLNGTENAIIGPQTVLPDVRNFTFSGMKTYNHMLVDVFVYKYHYGHKYNIYTLYVQHASSLPVYYEMLGYDSLLGSHFDEYKIFYGDLSTTFPEDTFDAPLTGMLCHGFPGPGYEAGIVANPMKEFIHPSDTTHFKQMYHDYTQTHKKSKSESKMHIFKHNLRYINSINRKGLSFKLKVNHLADHSPSELRHLRGRRTTVGIKGRKNNGKAFKKTLSKEDIPSQINWRLSGAVTPVKDQATCGSCWSFGTTGTIEGTLFLKTGRLIRLSQQHLMDCSWGFGNNGCDGGEEFRSYEYIMKHGGITTELSYGPYIGVDGYCHPETATIGANITGYVNVTSGDINALKEAIATKGPVAVGIDAAHLSFVFYSHGVYYEPKCGNTPDKLDHAVLAVGYGELDGKSYWLVKNSWSTHWGNDGYVLMSQKDNNCGVATDATYVEMA